MDSVTTSETRPKIACVECQRINDCDCLSQLRLLDLLVPLTRQLLDHVTTDGSIMGDEVPDQIALLLDRDDQRKRETVAMPEFGDPEDARTDQGLVEDVIGSWGYEPSFRRDAEGIAALRGVPVERVRALVDRFLADSRPKPAARLRLVAKATECDRCGQLEAAARRLLVDGADLAKGTRTRERHRAIARRQMRTLLGLPAPDQTPPPSRETWPAWAREVEAVCERRAA